MKSAALLAVLPLVLLSACDKPQQQPPPAQTAAITPEPSPSPAAPAPTPLNPPAPGGPGGLPDDRAPLPEGPIREGSAQDAANVVQTYYALLEQGKYTQAWALWDHGGQASGMTARQFADGFKIYSEYHANIGAPGRVDAGAGQRYVTVPVQVYGRVRPTGARFNQRGELTLHRTADIPGATAEQKSWRISASTIATAPTPPRAPRPDPPTPAPPPKSPPGLPDRVTAEYRCEDRLRLTVTFDNRAGTATVQGGGANRVTLNRQRAASGIHYAKDGYELRGKGDEATYTTPGMAPVPCRTAR